MEIVVSDKSQVVAVVKRAMFLAWQACGSPTGMGFLQDSPNADEDRVWSNVQRSGDYPGGPIPGNRPGEVHADYVFGRMMKLSIRWNAEKGTIDVSDSKPRGDYQAWCHKYPTYAALIESAVKSLVPQESAR